MIEYFEKYPLKTIKNKDWADFLQILLKLEKKYHYKTSVYKDEIDKEVEKFILPTSWANQMEAPFHGASI